MEIKKIIKALIDFKVIGSLIGYILLNYGYMVIGNVMWAVIDLFWVLHYRKMNDLPSSIIFIIWTILSTFYAIKHYFGF